MRLRHGQQFTLHNSDFKSDLNLHAIVIDKPSHVQRPPVGVTAWSVDDGAVQHRNWQYGGCDASDIVEEFCCPLSKQPINEAVMLTTGSESFYEKEELIAALRHATLEDGEVTVRLEFGVIKIHALLPSRSASRLYRQLIRSGCRRSTQVVEVIGEDFTPFDPTKLDGDGDEKVEIKN